MTADSASDEQNNAPLETEVILQIYTDASANMRHYSNLRFANLRLYATLAGAVIGGAVIATPEPTVRLSFGAAGVVFTLMLWIQEERVARYFHHYRAIAADLEDEIGLLQHASRPEGDEIGTLLTAANSVRGLLALGSFGFLALVVQAIGAMI